ncbi:MAG: hypothetical protein NTU62_02440 [Spirochaetes bacterium]|nr:hypothetical protein [Spirochaetota bacterium]
MHRSLKAAAVIAAMSLLAAASIGAAPRGAGQGMMGGREFDDGFGPGMMRGGWNTVPGWEDLKKLDKALTVETAKERVVSALKDWGYADLVVDTVTEYDNGFYALVKEKVSGKPALETFVDPTYGTVSAGQGPETSWNTKYGRALNWPLPSGKTITADEAKKLVQQWLDRSRDKTAYELKVVELPGYFSVQLQNGGKLAGVAAVNAYTSQVWYRGGRGGRLAVSDGSDAG